MARDRDFPEPVYHRRIVRSPYPDVRIPSGLLSPFVLELADGLGDKPAVVDAPSGRAVTYRELARRVSALAGGLARAAIGPATCSGCTWQTSLST